jgi:hypothetical protein
MNLDGSQGQMDVRNQDMDGKVPDNKVYLARSRTIWRFLIGSTVSRCGSIVTSYENRNKTSDRITGRGCLIQLNE